MKPTTRLAGSWWCVLPRIGYTAVALQELLTRMATSEFSIRTTNTLDGPSLFVPSKKTYTRAAMTDVKRPLPYRIDRKESH
jgi:hypothetical protein